jgi:hypothetical protein
MTDLRTALNTNEALDPPEEASEHRGSAPFNLSGRSVVVAWLVSITVHAVLMYVVGNRVFPFSASDSEADLPPARIDIVGPVQSASLMPSPVPDLTSKVTLPDPAVSRPPPKAFTELSELTTTKKPELSIIGIGAGGGDFDRYRIPLDIGAGSEFFGVGSSARGARRIVYVVDRSGSMIDSFLYVQEELKRSILDLRRSQKFHVIFFNAGPPLESPPKRLVSAIEGHKRQFFEFLDTVLPRGDTKPERAMQRALSLEPDLIYLLSDGIDFQPSLLRRLDEWNDRRRTRICTIAYLDQTGRELLELIAREHNGEFIFVSENDLP